MSLEQRIKLGMEQLQTMKKELENNKRVEGKTMTE